MRGQALFWIGATLLAGGMARADQLPIGPPPVSSEMPTYQEVQRHQNDVVPPAESQAQQLQSAAETNVYAGKLVEADPNTRKISIATDAGVQSIQLQPNTFLTVNGEPVSSFSSIPQGESVRATFEPSGAVDQLEITVIHPNGPDVRKPFRSDQPPVHP